MSNYDDYEYTPCIRKGKHKPKHKKQKNYIAKVQRMYPQEGKYSYDDYSFLVNDKTQYNELVNLLKSADWKNWNDDYEHLYKNIYKLYEVPELKSAYDKIQSIIIEEEIAFQYWYYDEEEEERYERYKWELYFSRWSRY